MKNSVFGKTMENKRKHRDVKLATTKKWRNYLVFKPNHYPIEIISNRNEKNPQMFINRSVYVGLLILEIIRIVTFEFNSTRLRKSTCVIIITFGNQILLWSKFQKIWVCKKLYKRWESFSPNTDNFLAFFIVFEWGRILESAMDK